MLRQLPIHRFCCVFCLLQIRCSFARRKLSPPRDSVSPAPATEALLSTASAWFEHVSSPKSVARSEGAAPWATNQATAFLEHAHLISLGRIIVHDFSGLQIAIATVLLMCAFALLVRIIWLCVRCWGESSGYDSSEDDDLDKLLALRARQGKQGKAIPKVTVQKSSGGQAEPTTLWSDEAADKVDTGSSNQAYLQFQCQPTEHRGSVTIRRMRIPSVQPMPLNSSASSIFPDSSTTPSSWPVSPDANAQSDIGPSPSHLPVPVGSMVSQQSGDMFEVATSVEPLRSSVRSHGTDSSEFRFGVESFGSLNEGESNSDDSENSANSPSESTTSAAKKLPSPKSSQSGQLKPGHGRSPRKKPLADQKTSSSVSESRSSAQEQKESFNDSADNSEESQQRAARSRKERQAWGQ